MAVRRTMIAGALGALMIGTLAGTAASGVDVAHRGVHAAAPVLAPVLRNYVAQAGIRTPDLTYSGKGVDVDRDGDEDLFISNQPAARRARGREPVAATGRQDDSPRRRPMPGHA